MDFSRILRDTLKIRITILWLQYRLELPWHLKPPEHNGVSMLVQAVVLWIALSGLFCFLSELWVGRILFDCGLSSFFVVLL